MLQSMGPPDRTPPPFRRRRAAGPADARMGLDLTPELALRLDLAPELAPALNDPGRPAGLALRPVASGPVRPWEDVAGTCGRGGCVACPHIFPACTLVHARTSDPCTLPNDRRVD